jgi:hypothetical protein
MIVPPICDCGQMAIYRLRSDHLYRRDYGPVWECAPCQAWVGCHPDGKPLGRLANASLRRAKQAAHAAFDPKWHAIQREEQCSKSRARGVAYKWLADHLGIDVRDCHIGMFDEVQCQRVVEICANV